MLRMSLVLGRAGDKNSGSSDPEGGKDDGKAGSSGGGGMDWDDAWSRWADCL